MPPVVLKLFAGQGTGRTDGQTDKAATICCPFGEHNKATASCKGSTRSKLLS